DADELSRAHPAAQPGVTPSTRKKMAVTERTSRPAVTHYRVRERFTGFTDLELRLETGRTHQIRVHMAHIGHPVAGDPVYGPKKVIARLSGQCLHARAIGFIHPRTGEYLEFTSGLPAYYTAFLDSLRGDHP
ncbi:pseudouridine synthase, partial [uncultured Anaerotruncus sp.]|uniref:RluA family pseudouridine synthase n=1 Tax=uncultured Anaerotruncus sp. TaxID=905011 RepID=UPI00258487F1